MVSRYVRAATCSSVAPADLHRGKRDYRLSGKIRLDHMCNRSYRNLLIEYDQTER